MLLGNSVAGAMVNAFLDIECVMDAGTVMMVVMNGNAAPIEVNLHIDLNEETQVIFLHTCYTIIYVVSI